MLFFHYTASLLSNTIMDRGHSENYRKILDFDWFKSKRVTKGNGNLKRFEIFKFWKRNLDYEPSLYYRFDFNEEENLTAHMFLYSYKNLSI